MNHKDDRFWQAIVWLVILTTVILITIATRSHASDKAEVVEVRQSDSCGGTWPKHSCIAQCDGQDVADQASDRIPTTTHTGVVNTRFQWVPGYLDYARGALDIAQRIAKPIMKWIRSKISGAKSWSLDPKASFRKAFNGL